MHTRSPVFEWDAKKSAANEEKHEVSFLKATEAFLDLHRVIVQDLGHSAKEERWFCLGKVDDGIMTVRFTYRGETIRIIGAGYWRKGKKRYEKENQIHR